VQRLVRFLAVPAAGDEALQGSWSIHWLSPPVGVMLYF
jgi:hypothetical protein